VLRNNSTLQKLTLSANSLGPQSAAAVAAGSSTRSRFFST